MLYRIGIICMIVVVAGLPAVFADIHEGQNEQEGEGRTPANELPTLENSQEATSIDQANRFLSAEATRQIRSAKDEMLTEMKEYQDQNFGILDARMHELMQDIRMKVMLATLGVILLAQGLAAYIMMRSFKNNSYEAFLEKTLADTGKNVTAETEPTARELQGVVQQQEKEWRPQQPAQTYGAQMGQAAASNQSMANEWQTEPAYAGAWESPVRAEKEYGEGVDFKALQDFEKTAEQLNTELPQEEQAQPWNQPNDEYVAPPYEEIEQKQNDEYTGYLQNKSNNPYS